MTDITQVFSPGWRATDPNGKPLSGAKLKFFQAGTTTPRSVYADEDLTESLGTIITCDSAGTPTSDGNAPTLIYTGLNPYKLEIYTAAGVSVYPPFDDIPGALDTSTFGGDTRITSPTDSVSTDQVLGFSDSGKLYNVNCSGGAVAFTLGAATSLEDGWRVGIRHNGSANQVKIVTTGGELIALPDLISTTAFSITTRGQEVWIRCDGAGFTVGETAPALLNTVGVINITDRLSAPPGSPTPGARYILLTTPTGDWSTFSQHDIVEANGQGGWIRYTPAADCGWLAYVIDEDINYQFVGSAWQTVVTKPATQAVQETGTSTVDVVVPATQKFHPLHAKAWGKIGTGLSYTGHGISSIADEATGFTTFSWSVPFSSADYCVVTGLLHAANAIAATVIAQATTGITLRSFGTVAGTNSDPTNFFVAAFGDQ